MWAPRVPGGSGPVCRWNRPDSGMGQEDPPLVGRLWLPAAALGNARGALKEGSSGLIGVSLSSTTIGSATPGAEDGDGREAIGDWRAVVPG